MMMTLSRHNSFAEFQRVKYRDREKAREEILNNENPMGEEKKNPEGEKKAEKKDKEEKVAVEEKPKAEEKKSDDGNQGKKDSKEVEPPSLPPPPPEIVMRVYMHCEGCARKVRRCLKGFDGVEDVITDCKTHKVVVKGEKADALKVVDRVHKKTHRQVQLLSPIAQQEKKPEVNETPKPEDIKEEPKVITVVLKVHMHCEACSLEIKKRVERMEEVEEAIPDLKSSQVSVKGTFDPPKLVEYVYKRTGKHATIVKQDPPLEKKEDDKGKDGKEEKKGEGGEEGKKGEEKGEEGKGEKKEEGGGGSGEGGADNGKAAAPGATAADGGVAATTGEEEAPKVVELKRNEYYYNPPRYGMEMYAYPPQIFSDENPNACSVM